jgi:DNA-binding transcriptional LysR family regulator
MKSAPLARLHSRLKMRHMLLLKALGTVPNLRRAAASLSLSQPVASALLKELEHAFGERLFERTARGLQPTPAGNALASWATLMLADIEAARDDLKAISQGRSHRLRIGVSPLAAPALLPEALGLFLEAYPLATFAVQTGLEDDLTAACLRGELDCIVCRLVPEATHAALRYVPLYSELSNVVVGVQHPLAGARPFVTTDMDRYPWILPVSRGAPFNLIAKRLLDEGCGLPRVVVETWSTIVITNLLRHKDWLAVLPRSVAKQGVAAGTLAVLPFALPDTLMPLAVISRKSTPENEELLAALLDALQKSARKLQKER